MILALLLAAGCPGLADVPAPGSCSFDHAGNSTCAHGATNTDDLEVICKQPTGKRRCNFDAAFRRKFDEAYNLAGDPFELDHVVSLELGGSNAFENLQPQDEKDSRAKDKVENKLHRLVCSGKMKLEAARQVLVSGGWRTFK